MVPGRNKVLLNKVERGCRIPDSGWEHLLPGCAPGSSDPDVGSGRVNPRLGEAGEERPGNSKALSRLQGPGVTEGRQARLGPGAGWAVIQLVHVCWRVEKVQWELAAHRRREGGKPW